MAVPVLNYLNSLSFNRLGKNQELVQDQETRERK